MANTLTNVLPTMLAQGVLALRQLAIGPRLVNRDYETMTSAFGRVISVPIPSAISARAVVATVVFNSNVNSSPTIANITLDHWMEAPFHMSDTDELEAGGGFKSMSASEAIKALGNDADAYLWGKHLKVYQFVGSAGGTPFGTSVTVAAAARTRLNKTLAPPDNRFAVLDADAEGLLLQTSNILQFDQRGDQGGIINGSIGTKLGFAWYMDQNITSYTPGTGWVSGFVASTVSAAAGDTTMNILNATSSGTIKVGDIFTVGSGFYVVTAAATASSTVAVAIAFSPALATAVSTGSAITCLATAYVVNIAAHRDGFAWASRPLSGIFGGGNVFQAPTDPVSGIALRLELSRQYKQDTFSYDYLAGANVVRPELICKILG